MIASPASPSHQTFEASDGIFHAPPSLSGAVLAGGLELESNTDQIDLGYRTVAARDPVLPSLARRFLGDRAATKSIAVDLTESRIDAEDFAEIDDVFHAVDWLDWLSDGSLNGLSDGRLWENLWENINMRLHRPQVA